jgi:hypothetical protein
MNSPGAPDNTTDTGRSGKLSGRNKNHVVRGGRSQVHILLHYVNEQILVLYPRTRREYFVRINKSAAMEKVAR